MTLRGWLLMLLLTAALAAGCGGGMDASVSGTVTLDGQPLKTGNVAFHPQQEGPVGNGSIDASGKYQLNTGTEKGIVPGEYTVTVVATEPIPETSGNEPPQPPKVLTPAKYGDPKTSDLKFTVKGGGNTIDLPLKSQ